MCIPPDNALLQREFSGNFLPNSEGILQCQSPRQKKDLLEEACANICIFHNNKRFEVLLSRSSFLIGGYQFGAGFLCPAQPQRRETQHKVPGQQGPPLFSHTVKLCDALVIIPSNLSTVHNENFFDGLHSTKGFEKNRRIYNSLRFYEA